VAPGDRFTAQGYVLPFFVGPDKCNACGICGLMCPDFAIEVYKYVGEEAPSA
jgi:NAD-dependent dihydropyrimidine dehydrogenase PreA subunit